MNSVISTDALTSSGVVTTGKTYLNGVIVNTDGTNDATVIIYDNTAASGKIIAQLTVTGANHFGSLFSVRGIQASSGLYISISGTGASANVSYGAA